MRASRHAGGGACLLGRRRRSDRGSLRAMTRLGWGFAVGALATALGAAVSTFFAAAAEVDAGRRKAESCAPCHGLDGNSTKPDMPSLAGQPLFYLHWQLLLFRDKRRTDPQMSAFAVNLSDRDIAELAAYYAAQKPVPRSAGPVDPARIAAGRRLAQTHHCGSCHAPGFTGHQYAPRLAGLSYEYLVKQLRGFKAQTRGELDGTMTLAAQPLSDEDIEHLARYIASFVPAP